MRLLVLLALLGATSALMEALSEELKGWYKAYLIERVTPGMTSWIIGRGCKHTRSEPFNSQIEPLGLPEFYTCTFKEFIKHVATGEFKKRWVMAQHEPFDVPARDVLVNMQEIMDAVEGTFKVEASDIIFHKDFKAPAKTSDRGGKVTFNKLQKAVADHVELCRSMAAESGNADAIRQIEQWTLDRAESLRMANEYRISDQAKFELPWISQNTDFARKGDKPKSKFQLITDTRTIRYADGQLAPVSNSAREKNLGTYDVANWDASFSQKPSAGKVRKATIGITKTYGAYTETPGPGKTAYDHISIIKQNVEDIDRHQKPPTPMCERGRRRAARGGLAPSSFEQSSSVKHVEVAY